MIDIFEESKNAKKEWDTVKNIDINPKRLTHKQNAYFICRICKKEYKKNVLVYLKNNISCNICSKFQFKVNNSIAERFPEKIKFWSSRNLYPPENISVYKRNMDIYWDCDVCKKTYSSPAKSMRADCTYCRVNLFDRYPEFMIEWDFAKNDDNPREIYAKHLYKVVWWICPLGHSWYCKFTSRSTNGTQCMICSNQVLLIGFNDLETKRPDLALLWDYEKNNKSPSQVRYCSDEEIYWKCDKDSRHKFKRSLFHMLSNGCSFCSNSIIKSGINDFATRRPDLILEWDWSKNTIDPSTVSCGNLSKVWWICSKESHSWPATIHGRNNGNGCPQCAQRRSKSEEELFAFLKEIAADSVMGIKSILHPYEIDIYSSKNNKAIEFNGDYWHSNERVFNDKKAFKSSIEYHQFKKDKCLEKNIELAFVWEFDWKNNKEDVIDSIKRWINNDEKLENLPILTKLESILDNEDLYR